MNTPWVNVIFIQVECHTHFDTSTGVVRVLVLATVRRFGLDGVLGGENFSLGLLFTEGPRRHPFSRACAAAGGRGGGAHVGKWMLPQPCL